MAPPTPHGSTYSPWLHSPWRCWPCLGGADLPRLAARGARHPPRCRALGARRAHRARRPRLPRLDAAPRRRSARPGRAAPCAEQQPTASAHLARQLGWGTRPASARLGSGQPPASASLGQLAEARCRPASPSLSSAHRLCAPRYAPPPPPPRWVPRRVSLASASARPGRRRMQRGGRRAALRVERRGRASCAPGRASDHTRRRRSMGLRFAPHEPWMLHPGATSAHPCTVCVWPHIPIELIYYYTQYTVRPLVVVTAAQCCTQELTNCH